MVEIIKIDELKEKQNNAQKVCPDIDKNIMEQIMVDPMYCLNNDDFMLTYVVNNGINAALLCEALGIYQLSIEINGQEYKISYCKPHPMYEHSDVIFNTDKFNKYMDGPLLAKNRLIKEMENNPLPKNIGKKGMSPLFQKV